MNTSTIRTRWAAVGAAVAISLGAGGIGISHATTSTGERPVYIPLDAPCRLADNRPAGIGPDTSVTFDGWGTVGDCTLPNGTSGLALNVTAVDATQQTNLRFYPADAALPGTANLNPTPGAPPIPNAVNVALSSSGEFKVYNRFGNVAVVIDVMGVYDDHNHDDRYYQKSEVDAAVAPKANSADVYTRPQVDNQTSRIASSTAGQSGGLSDGDTLTTVTITLPTKQFVYLSADAAIFTNSAQGAACSSALFCNVGIAIYDADTNTRLTRPNGAFFRLRDDSDGQSLAISVVVPADAGTHTYRLETEFNQVVANDPFVNYATLTAMSVPFGGTGSAPAAAATAQAVPSGADAATG